MRATLAAFFVLTFSAVAFATESGGGPAPAAPAAAAAPAATAAPAAPAAMAAPAAPAAGGGSGAASSGGGAAGGAAGASSKAAKSSSGGSSSGGSSGSADTSAAADAAKVTTAECDLCRARSAFLKAGKPTSKALDNGLVITATGNMAALSKAAADYDTQIAAAKDGKAKLDEACAKFAQGLSAGTVTFSNVKDPKNYVLTATSSDADYVLELYELMEKVVVSKKPGKK